MSDQTQPNAQAIPLKFQFLNDAVSVHPLPRADGQIAASGSDFSAVIEAIASAIDRLGVGQQKQETQDGVQ